MGALTEPADTAPTTGITIGLPVYNGARYLEAALESILSQTYTDLEVVVQDNASTDATGEIAKRFAERDPRVRYRRNPENVGAPRNFNLAFADATRPYYKWASHDDLMRPGFLEACIGFLEANPEHVACFTEADIVDEDGHPTKPLPNRLRALEEPWPERRLADITRPWYGCFHVWSVMRTDAIRRTRLHGSYPGSDRVFLAEMALQGPMATLPDRHFLLRGHGGRSVASLPTIYSRRAWFDPRKGGLAILPHWRLGAEYLRALERDARLSARDRAAGVGVVARWVWRDFNWVKLALDLLAPFVPGVPELFVRGRTWVRRMRKRRAAG